jgi:hypothetical protein
VDRVRCRPNRSVRSSREARGARGSCRTRSVPECRRAGRRCGHPLRVNVPEAPASPGATDRRGRRWRRCRRPRLR